MKENSPLSREIAYLLQCRTRRDRCQQIFALLVRKSLPILSIYNSEEAAGERQAALSKVAAQGPACKRCSSYSLSLIIAKCPFDVIRAHLSCLITNKCKSFSCCACWISIRNIRTTRITLSFRIPCLHLSLSEVS